jgi:DNA replication protein DnaC
LRVGRKSTIITTNLSFDRWSELFGDPVLTSALVDRLTHKAYIINMNGESFRLRETKELLKK